MYVLFYKRQIVSQEVDNTQSKATTSEHNETLPHPANFPTEGPDNDSVSSSVDTIGSFTKIDQFDDLEGEETDTTSHQNLKQTMS